MKALTVQYNNKKREIKKRLKEFRDLKETPDEDIFAELCFCLLTPQSKAVYCDEAIRKLKKTGLLYKGKRHEIREKLGRVRFPNNKTDFLLKARKVFLKRGRLDVKVRISPDDIPGTRDWLVRNVKGLGYKEASHFLRNIGYGKGIAILDVHILRNLKKHKIIKSIPPSISKKKYLAIETCMKQFSKKIDISRRKKCL